jgi:hypothetical protein
VSASTYLTLALVIVALGVLARVAVSVLRRLGRLAAEARELQDRVGDARQLQARLEDLNARVAELQQGVARLKA